MRVKWLRNKRYIVTVLMKAYVNMNVCVVYCAYKYSENYSSCTQIYELINFTYAHVHTIVYASV